MGLKVLYMRIGPDNFRPIIPVQMFDALAGIDGDFPERIDTVGANTGQHLHAGVSGARRTCVGTVLQLSL